MVTVGKLSSMAEARETRRAGRQDARNAGSITAHNMHRRNRWPSKMQETRIAARHEKNKLLYKKGCKLVRILLTPKLCTLIYYRKKPWIANTYATDNGFGPLNQSPFMKQTKIKRRQML